MPRVIFATVAVVAVLGVGVMFVRDVGGDSGPARRDIDWSAFEITRYGLSGALPSGWHLASSTQTPRLHDPREVMTAATFALGTPAGRCNHLPAGAVAAMGATDALVSVQERGRGAPVSDFRPRPARFAVPEPSRREETIQQCVDAPVSARVSRDAFSDGARAFHVLVVLGENAPPAVEAQALEILNRLRFDQVFRPNWDFAG
jgi:hypothetical protein